MSNWLLLPCKNCGANKSCKTHSFGKYKIQRKGKVLKLVCVSCRHKQNYEFEKGDQFDEECY